MIDEILKEIELAKRATKIEIEIYEADHDDFRENYSEGKLAGLEMAKLIINRINK